MYFECFLLSPKVHKHKDPNSDKFPVDPGPRNEAKKIVNWVDLSIRHISILQSQNWMELLESQNWRPSRAKYSNQNITLKVGEEEAKLGHKAQNIFNIIQETYKHTFTWLHGLKFWFWACYLLNRQAPKLKFFRKQKWQFTNNKAEKTKVKLISVEQGVSRKCKLFSPLA